MANIVLIKHYKGAPGLRLLGLGPNCIPCQGMKKLREFLNRNAFWAKNRSLYDLKHCLAKSDVIVSLWEGKEIVGFGRALSDGIYRSVLWDIVIGEHYQGNGFGKIVVSAILNSKEIQKSQKIYLMTTNQRDFYYQLDFEEVQSQKLLLKEK